MKATTWNRICLFLAFAGVFVAGYMTLSSLGGFQLPCGQSSGCDVVESSPYSHWFGIPVAMYGLFAYLTLAAFGIARSIGPRDQWKLFSKLGLAVSGIGTLVSAYLLFFSVNQIGVTCLWCLSSGIIMLLSFFAHGFLGQTEPEEAKSSDTPYLVVLLVLAVAGVGFRFADLKKLSHEGTVSADLLPSKIEDMIPPNPHIYGPDNAPVIIVEFGDLLCPHCRASYHELKNVVNASNGNVELVYRQFPLIYNVEHQKALPAAAVSELAAQKGKFWDFLDEMYDDNVDQEHVTLDEIKEFAQNLGISGDKVDSTLLNQSDPIWAKVQADIAEGNKLKIAFTPTLVIGIRGQAPQSGSSSDVDAMLKQPPYSKYVRGLG